MREVGVDGMGASVAEAERSALLPAVGEAVDVDQLGGVVPVSGDHRERAACVHGLQLGVVADQQHLRSSSLSKVRDAVEREGARQ